MVYEALPRFYPDGIHAKCSLFAIDCEYIEKLRYGLDEGARSYRCVSAAYHEELEILSLISGSLEVVIDGNSVILSPGECAVILPYREHSAYCPTDGETTKYYCVKIEVGRFLNGTGSLADELRAISECRFSCPEKIDGEKGSALSRLAEELYGVSDGADRLSPVKQAEKMAVVWKILAVIVGERLPDSGRRIAARNIDFIRRVSSIVEENYQTGLTSRDAAARMNYTLTYFCRVFRKCFGKSFSAYLTEYRVFMATCMRGQCATIAEIAEKVGFDDYCYFSNVFRRQVGVSPREYFRGNG